MTVIKTPELPRLIVAGSTGYKYVFEYKNHWDKEKQRAVRRKGDTKSVGKYVPVEGKENCGELLFNDDFKKRFPELDNLRVFRYKGGRLEFKPLDDQEDQASKPKEIERLHAGATWSLNQIVGSSPVARALRAVFPEYRGYLKILSLVYFLILNRDGSLCNYEEFAECTWLPYQRALTSGTISRFLRRINKKKISAFFKKLNEEYRKDWGGEMLEHRFWALDSTTITSYSDGISTCDYGKNKDLIDAPQTNVLLVVDEKTGAPVFFRNYHGNVPDVSTLRNTLAEMQIAGVNLSDAVLVTDRGYGSKANYDDMLRNGVSFISNARLNLNSQMKKLVDANYSKLLNWNNTNSYLNQSCVTVQVDWAYDEYPVDCKKDQLTASTKLFAHIYFNKAVYDETANSLRGRLITAAESYNTKNGKVSEAEQKLVDTFMDIKDAKAEINMLKVDEKLRYAGMRILLSDTIGSAVECHRAYEERNQVEYAFNTIKARLNCNRTLVHSTENWEAKLFLQVIATSIAGMVRAKVKGYNESAAASKGSYRVHYDSDHKLLAKLNNVYVTKFNEGWLFDEVVGKRKELFGILGVPVPSVEREAYVGIDGDDDQIDDDTDDLGGLIGGQPLKDDI